MNTSTLEHRDDEGAKIGMWIFIFTELFLFGGLFVTYAVYRFQYHDEFHLAARELSTTMGFVNTILLLISSTTLAMSITTMKQGNKRITSSLITLTIVLGIVFMINKYFEWSDKFEHGIFPGSETLQGFSHGEILFYGLYFFMTGLHAVHIIVGIIFMIIVLFQIKNNSINSDDNIVLENCGLYWHLVDLIWIFLFPLFYLIT